MWNLQNPVRTAMTDDLSVTSPVNVSNEWAPLQEVIVGTIDDMRIPEWDRSLQAVVPEHGRADLQRWSGRRFPQGLVELARKEVDGLADFFAREGVTVRRPDPVDHHRPVVTPYFSTGGGFYSAMPRDGLFAIDDQIIETPMAWRSRYFEAFPFRSILMDYFSRGARWTAGPRPRLADDLWTTVDDDHGEGFQSSIAEVEPVFDAADFVRIGDNTIVGQLSHVTNRAGAEWLQRQLGPDYRVLTYVFDDSSPMHIDTTLLPLGPGKVLINQAWVSQLPDIFADWEVLVAPPSQLDPRHPLWFTSTWIHCNIMMLDEQHVLVEQDEHDLADMFRRRGFTPIPLPFKHFQTFGGSFHCATLDVRRGSK